MHDMVGIEICQM